MEHLLHPVIPLDKSLVHSNMPNFDTCKKSNLRASLKDRGEANTANTSPMYPPVANWTPEEVALVGAGIVYRNFLKLRHLQVRIEVTGCNDGQLLHKIVAEHLDIF